ncbi:MAG: chromosome partitioning protein ParB, partial [Myxococcota bacterium]|nr:chromosome partitioning protein ParB [Myxococcota bacterium]
MTAKQTPRKKSPAKRASGSARKRITPAREARGLAAGDVALALDAVEVAPLAAEIARAGGAALGAYREPLSGRPILLAVLPRDAVEPTPFQRDLSPTHAKRLAQKIDEA